MGESVRIFATLAVVLVFFPALVGADSTEVTANHASLIGEFPLWDAAVPLPAPEQLAYPTAVTDVVVHRADAGYRFLHDNAVAWHANTLFAAWYNCPTGEIQGASCIRGRRSADQGKTWSEVEVIAADEKGEGTFYVPVSFLSCEGRLHAYVSNMVGHDLVTRCEVFTLDESAGRWNSRGYIAGPFLPNCPPLLMDDGNYIMAGRMAAKSATTPEIPAVALSPGKDVTSPWDVIPMMHSIARPYTDFPESTVWLDGPNVTAITRGSLAFTSTDFGRTWRGPYRHNLPAEDSKPFAVRLSTGQRCFLWNYPKGYGTSRHLLTVAVSRPGGKELEAMWKIRDGNDDAVQAAPEWSYPCAVEHEGKLYVIYTSGKKHSVMTIIPVSALAVPAR